MAEGHSSPSRSARHRSPRRGPRPSRLKSRWRGADQGRWPGFLLHQPALGGADGSVSGGFAFQQKGGAVGNLRDGRVDAEVPYRCSDQVLAGLEQRRQVEALVAPMGQVAAGRAVAHPMAVHKQNEAVVGADADRIAGGNGSQRERAAEVEHQRLAQRGRGMGDPGGLPFAVGRVGLEDCSGRGGRGWPGQGRKKSKLGAWFSAFRFPTYSLAGNENQWRIQINFAAGKRSICIHKGSSRKFNRRVRGWEP